MTTRMINVERLARLALQFGRVNRVTFHEDGVRPETDTDHTVMVGLVACAWAAEVHSKLDLGLVAQFAFVHDFVEVHVGDTNSFAITPESRLGKEARERGSLTQLHLEFGFSLPWIPDTIDRYESQVDPEARFVKLLDKVLPKFTHTWNHGVEIRKLGKTKADLEAAHVRQLEELSLKYGDEFPETITLLERSMRNAVLAWEEA